MNYKEQRERLVQMLKIERRIKTKEVEKAFLETPRELFVPEKLKQHAYIDTPLEIGNGQTISAPFSQVGDLSGKSRIGRKASVGAVG